MGNHFFMVEALLKGKGGGEGGVEICHYSGPGQASPSNPTPQKKFKK